MALLTCKDCGGEISSEAKACPKCGAKPPKRTSLFVKVLAVIAIPAVLYSVTRSNADSEKRSQAAAAKEAALTPAQKIARQAANDLFAANVARAQQAVDFLKTHAKNPDSLQLETVFATDAGAICIQYRATNSFNAVVPGVLVLPKDIKQVSQGTPTATAPAWNKHCANTNGRDMKNAI